MEMNLAPHAVRVQVAREPDAHDLPLPSYATAGAAGMDLLAAVSGEVTIAPGERTLIPTGLRIALPPGYEGQVRGRSGLALKHGLGLPNAPGTIDSDYRGVVSVIVINWGADPVTVRRGDRIAQLVVAPVARVEWDDAGDALPPSTRGDGGFGHTGIALQGEHNGRPDE
jgi:dUTP pyrophosphatase